MTLREQVDALMTQRATAEGGWDDQINAFTEFVYMQLEEQRELCGDAVVKQYHNCPCVAGDYRNACLTATGEKE